MQNCILSKHTTTSVTFSSIVAFITAIFTACLIKLRSFLLKLASLNKQGALLLKHDQEIQSHELPLANGNDLEIVPHDQSNQDKQKASRRKTRRPRNKKKQRSNMKNSLSPQRKEIPTSSLLTYAYTRNWQNLDKFAKLYPYDLNQSNEYGQLPLHIACSAQNTQMYVLRTMLEVAPETVACSDDEGSTPLHYLLHYGSPDLNVMNLLIDTNSDVLCALDDYGRSPLFHAVESDLSLEKLELLLGRGNASRTILQPCGPTRLYRDPKEGRGKTQPGRLATAAKHRTPLYMAWARALSSKRSRFENHEKYLMRGKHWDKAMYLLQQAYKLECPSAKFRLLHAVLHFYSYLPIDVVDFVFALKHHANEREEGSGRLPLHIAAAISGTDDDTVCIIDTLCRMHPEAAFEPTFEGRLPLHEALAVGKSWNSATTQILWQANPDALKVVDGKSGLFPFMIVASCVIQEDNNDGSDLETLSWTPRSAPSEKEFVCEKCKGVKKFVSNLPEGGLRNDREKETAAHLDRIFELLRMTPDVIV